MLAEQVNALHVRGLKAIGYYHVFSSEPLAREHPEWVERNADGTPRGTAMCLISPLFEEFMLPHVAEIVSLYDVDSVFFDGCYAHSPCFCDACRQRFAADNEGLDLPVGANDPNWARFVAWKLDLFRDLRRRVCDTIHALRPEVVVSFNWTYAPRMPEVVPAFIGALMADIMPDDQVVGGSYFGAYWALLDRPFDIMNSAFLQWWGDWGCKPALAMQQEVATAIAHGGLTWIGYQMQQDFDVQPAVMEELGKTLAFVEQRDPLLKGAQPVLNVAVLHSTSGYFTGDQATFFVRETSARGAHRMLTQSMVPHHVVNEDTLAQRLGDFRAVIIPDQRHLPPALVASLEDWVQAGGVLIAMGLSGTADVRGAPTGGFALGDLLGLQLVGKCDQSHAYIEVADERLKPGTLDMPHLAEAPFAFVQPMTDDVTELARLRKCYLRGDGEYLLRWSPVGADSGHPAITVRRVGKGWAAYIAGDLCHAYQVKNQWNCKVLVANLLNMLMPEPPVRVEAPAWVEVVLTRQPGRLIVHLINQHGDHAVDTNFRVVEQVLPVRGISVQVRVPERPSAVTLEPGGVVPEWSFADGAVTVQVPEVHLHTAIVMSE